MRSDGLRLAARGRAGGRGAHAFRKSVPREASDAKSTVSSSPSKSGSAMADGLSIFSTSPAPAQSPDESENWFRKIRNRWSYISVAPKVRCWFPCIATICPKTTCELLVV